MSEKTIMVADLIRSLAQLLIDKKYATSVEQALGTVLNSDTYMKVMDERTHLWYQSPRYVFSFLNTELKTGKIG
jgi:hypothetical protein